jgi:hypothetical protein
MNPALMEELIRQTITERRDEADRARLARSVRMGSGRTRRPGARWSGFRNRRLVSRTA